MADLSSVERHINRAKGVLRGAGNKEFTGAAAKLTAKDISRITESNIFQRMYGKLAKDSAVNSFLKDLIRDPSIRNTFNAGGFANTKLLSGLAGGVGGALLTDAIFPKSLAAADLTPEERANMRAQNPGMPEEVPGVANSGTNVRQGGTDWEYIKKLFSAPETSGQTTGKYSNWLQLEKASFDDLKKRNKLEQGIDWKQLTDPETYDAVAQTYITDIMETFKIPTYEEAALWSWRPAWYKKYGGDVTKIPYSVKGVAGKPARVIMEQRQQALQGIQNGYRSETQGGMY